MLQKKDKDTFSELLLIQVILILLQKDGINKVYSNTIKATHY